MTLDAILPPNLISFLALTFVICLTPGPAVLFVLGESAWRGRAAGLGAVLGINVANLVYYALTAAGLAALIASSSAAFQVLKWLGVVWLAWLGISALRESFKASDTDAAPPPRPASRSLWNGVIVQLANPKALLYFIALLPQFIDPARSIAGQVIVLAFTGCAIEILVLGGYVFAASRVRDRLIAHQSGLQRGVGGAFLILAGAAALYRRAA